MKYVAWACRLTASIIFFQTLFFKFTAAPESVYIFETLGLGAVGRIGAGISELIAGVLILIPQLTKVGSLAAINIMAGAILSHLVVLGIEIQNDGGLLFSLAIVVMLCSIANIFLTKKKFKFLQFEI